MRKLWGRVIRSWSHGSDNNSPSPLPEPLSSGKERLLTALFSFVFFAALYAFTAAPSLGMCHDTGELTTACVIQGVPHSPGYPLFVAIGWLWQQLPLGGDAAYRLNLLSGIELALALAFFTAALGYVSRPPAALLGSFLTGLSSAVWRQGVVTEVFALFLLFLSILIWLALDWAHSGDLRRRELLLVASFILGCCLAHQHIITLAAPAFLVYGLLARGRGRAWGVSWLMIPIFLLSWLLPYALQAQMSAQSPALNWMEPTNWQRMQDHFLRRSYGTGVLNPASLNYDRRAGEAQVTTYWIGFVRNYFPFPGFVLILIALDHWIRRRGTPFHWLCAGLACFYGPFFAWLGNQPSEEFYSDLLERFYSGSMLGWGGLVALGAQVLVNRWTSERSRNWGRALVLLPIWVCFLNYPKCSQRGQYQAVDTYSAFLALARPGSVVFVGGDLPGGAVEYLQLVQRKYLDRVVVLSGVAIADWYRRGLPVSVTHLADRAKPGEKTALEWIAEAVLSRGRHLYVSDPGVKVRGVLVRLGMIFQFYKNKAATPPPAQRTQELRRIYDLLEKSPRRGDYKLDWRQNFWIRFCIQQWIDAYSSLATELSDTDPEIAVQAWTRVAEMEEYQEPETYLARAALLFKLGRYDQALADYRVALRLVPHSDLARKGLAGVYHALGDDTRARYYAPEEVFAPTPSPASEESPGPQS